VKLSAGPEIFMPTEFLHGLYDGGIGAGLRDYWEVMGRSPTVAGGFFWAFADEGIARSDRDGKLDNVGNSAPDGMLGARHEKEGSYFTVKQTWSPVQLHDIHFGNGMLAMRVENLYDFLDLACCSLRWRRGEATGRAALPAVAARASADWSLRLPFMHLGVEDILELTVLDEEQRELWTWTLAGEPPILRPRFHPPAQTLRSGNVVEAGGYALEFDPDTGSVIRISRGDRTIPLQGPRLVAYQRESPQRGFKEAVPSPRLRKLVLAPVDAPGILARAEYDGALRQVTWSLFQDRLTLSYDIDYRGSADLLGLNFDYPEQQVLGKRWFGAARTMCGRIARTARGWVSTRRRTRVPYPAKFTRTPSSRASSASGAGSKCRLPTAMCASAMRTRRFPGSRCTHPPVARTHHRTAAARLVVPARDPADRHQVHPPDVLGPQSQPTEFSRPVAGAISIELLPR
jgi:hypothetical protein